MARLNLGSGDDDFPDIGELVKGAARKGKVVGKQGSQRVTGTTTKISKGKAGIEKEGEEATSEKPTAKPKKRVLKQKAENPLLRPINNSRTSSTTTASEVAMRRPKNPTFVEEKEVMERPRRKEKERVFIEISESEEETDLGGFIVSDDCVDSTFCEEEDVGIEELEESLAEKQREPPRSVRRLVRGRRERTPDEELEMTEDPPAINFKTEKRELDLEFGMRNLGLGSKEDKISKLPGISKKSPENARPSKPKQTKVKSETQKDTKLVSREPFFLESEDESDLGLERMTRNLDIGMGRREGEKSRRPNEKTVKNELSKPKPTKKDNNPKKKPVSNSDTDDPFTLQYFPSKANPRKVSKEPQFQTPPSSPDLKPKSPYKKPAIIPDSPHKQDSDAFWSQDVINDWNDEYSPRKTIKPTPKAEPIDDSTGRLLFSPTKKTLAKQDRLIKDAKKAFSEKKHAIAEAFLLELDKKITEGKVSELATSTGGIKIIWSKKLNTTAGRANWKRETIKSSSGAQPIHRHYASIELAEKVIDDEDRLLNVIAHEFCHLANFMISNIKTNPHGKEFKAWASKCSTLFGHRGIEVTTKHSYAIDYKYIWTCEHCGLEFKRHSKSIDPKRHQCGACKNKLIQTKPVPRKGTEGVNGYQAFVKEHMKIVREENPGSPQKEIMGLVGKRYQEFKASKLGGGTAGGGKKEMMTSKEGTPLGEDETEGVIRKLDFLDLTGS